MQGSNSQKKKKLALYSKLKNKIVSDEQYENAKKNSTDY